MFKVIQSKGRQRQNLYISKDKYSHSTEIIMYLIFVFGLVTGSIAVKKCENSVIEKLYVLFENYISVKSTQTVFTMFCTSFFFQMLIILVLYCVGLCAVGKPFLFLSPFIIGSGMSVVSTFLYKKYLLKGIGYCALMLYPKYIALAVCTVYACCESTKMSDGIMKKLIADDTLNLEFKNYNLRFLTIVLILALTTIIAVILNRLFSGYFQFS